MRLRNTVGHSRCYYQCWGLHHFAVAEDAQRSIGTGMYHFGTTFISNNVKALVHKLLEKIWEKPEY
jgi:hypothetical protein